MDLKELIRTIPDFPEKGILFRDITTLLKEPEGLQEALHQMQDAIKDMEYDVIVGPESRGFIFGVPLAYVEKKGFVPVRKPGKLPAAVYSQEYDLEYGKSCLEIRRKQEIKFAILADKILSEKGQKVLIVDDLLATGGTGRAIAQMVTRAGAEVAGFLFLIELEALGGRETLKDYSVQSIIRY